MNRIPRSVSLVVTTYNWEEALSLVLASVARQSHLPDEVIVADDGSGAATAALLRKVAQRFPIPLRHSWQEDDGFRVARSRNRAIAAATGEYVILLDGDMVMHPRFVADHLVAAERGTFVQGSRVLTTPEFRQRALTDPDMRPGLFSVGIARRRHTLRLPTLSRLYLRFGSRDRPHAIKTCNQAWWRDDLLRLNGFDERMQGWGREDVELAWRAHHAGLKCRQLRLAALAFHLHHKERHQDGASRNDIYLAQTLENRLTRCEVGLDQHLRAFLADPLPALPGAQRLRNRA